MGNLAPTPADPRMYPIFAAAGFGPEVFNPRQHRSCELVDLYVVRIAIHLVRVLGLVPALTGALTVDEILVARGFAPAFRAPLGWLLERLVAADLLAREDRPRAPRYRLVDPLPEPGLEAARAEGLATDPSYAASYDLLDQAAVVYPKVAAGGTSGERALFQRVSLWGAYFSNSNGYYALNNRVAATVAAGLLPPDGGRILEIGAGLGSATAALLDLLGPRARKLIEYRVTEPVEFFRRRAERSLAAAAAPLSFAALDINRPWRAQGVAPRSCDLVWGVNVFHLARRLDEALAEAGAALANGGWLVIGEGVRPAPGRAVSAEFPFQLLGSYVDVELDPARRPNPGFLTAAQWQHELALAGFSTVAVVPDVARLLQVHPGFFAAAVTGRR